MNIINQVQKIQDSAISDPRFKQNEEIQITPEAVNYVDKVFRSILPHFPAWRQTCPTDADLGMMKAAWTKAIVRHSMKTGALPNAKAGVTACEESDSDWLPSVGKFIKWCDQSNDLMPMAQRALDLFNSAQKQIDNVGQMVIAKHKFDLKQMKASDSNKRFIELYLSYAENNAIESLDAFALEDMTTSSYEERKLAREREERSDEENEARDEAAKAGFFSLFGQFVEKNPNIPADVAKKAIEEHHGIKQGSLKKYAKTPAQLEENKQRQLKIAKGLMK